MRIRLVASLILSALALPAAADACGLAMPAAAEPPYLSEEQVLIVWNEQTKIEHFVREVRFEKANQTFGFIVPTPTKPEIAKVEKSPFPDLDRDAPYPTFSGLGLGGFGHGGGGGTGMGYGGGSAVEVKDVKRIGRFKAFTLAAHDATGFRKWLDDNGFATTPELDKWSGHYIDLGFHFVAFRYDAKKDEAPGMTSETVRISFESELPYYPYFEPKPPAKQDVRRLTTWFVSQHGRKPIATMAQGSVNTLVHPWYAGSEYSPTVEAFAKTLGELGALLPIDQPELQVQVFRDHKVSREGFHDVLFVPLEPPAADATIDPATEAKHRAMVRWLDPTVPKMAPPAPAKVMPAPPPPVVAAPSSSCSYGSSGSLAVPFLITLAWLVRSRRRAALALVVLASCKKEAPPPPTPAPSVSVVAAPTPSTSAPSEKETVLLHAMQGILPARMVAEGGPWAISLGLGTWQTKAYAKTKASSVRITEKTVDVAGTLPPDVIKRILRANFPRFRACYELGLRRDPALAGSVEMNLVIDETGAVESANLGKGSLTDAQVRSCDLGILRTLSFPEPEKGKVKVKLEYDFSNKKS